MRILDARALSAADAARALVRDRAPWDRALAASREILDRVARDGDEALLALAGRFDGVRPPRLVLRREDFESALGRIPRDLRDALAFAADRIRVFHRAQVPVGYEVPLGPGGSRAGQQPRALDRVGVYVPAGPAGYPSSVLMGVIPARLAGVREVVVATPPSKTGTPPDSVLAAAALAGVDEVLVSGGAQAIGALAFGTASVRPVDKIVGPGNLYVTAAKLLVQDRVATDGIAGPSEVLVVADETLSTEALAAELLAQAEHDPEAVVIGVLVDDRSAEEVQRTVRRRASVLPRSSDVLATLERNGTLVRVASASQAIELANGLAPEHLVLAIRDADSFLYAVRNAGCVFLGPSTTAPLGDYTAGTNHILPTAGSARSRGGLGVRDFVKFLSYVEAAPSDLPALAAAGATIARAEGFPAHAAALESRLSAKEAVLP